MSFRLPAYRLGCRGIVWGMDGLFEVGVRRLRHNGAVWGVNEPSEVWVNYFRGGKAHRWVGDVLLRRCLCSRVAGLICEAAEARF